MVTWLSRLSACVQLFTQIDSEAKLKVQVDHTVDFDVLYEVIMNERIPTKDLHEQAERCLVDFFSWSIRCCMEGRAPDEGFRGAKFALGSLRAHMAGKYIAGGNMFCFGGHKADRKARVQVHRFRNNYMASYVCEHCSAVKPGKNVDPAFSYADFSPRALWRETLTGHSSYLICQATSNLTNKPTKLL